MAINAQAVRYNYTRDNISNQLKANNIDCCFIDTCTGATDVDHFAQWMINMHPNGPQRIEDTLRWSGEYALKRLFCCKTHQVPVESDNVDARCKGAVLCCLATTCFPVACQKVHKAHTQAKEFYDPKQPVMMN